MVEEQGKSLVAQGFSEALLAFKFEREFIIELQ